VAADGSHLALGEAEVPYDGPVGELIRSRAQGRVVQVAGLQFTDPAGERVTHVYLTRVQAYVDWKMALLTNAAGEAIGFISPRSHVWLLGTNDDRTRAFTRDGWQLKPQFPEQGLPWMAWLSRRVDRYAPVSRFTIGTRPADPSAADPGPEAKGLVDGLGTLPKQE
jgi:hypothetical protein